jgi:hypothetical protein
MVGGDQKKVPPTTPSGYFWNSPNLHLWDIVYFIYYKTAFKYLRKNQMFGKQDCEMIKLCIIK